MMVERDPMANIDMRDGRSLIGVDDVYAVGWNSVWQRPFQCTLKTFTSSFAGDDGIGLRLLLAPPARPKRWGVGNEAASATQSP